jgi:hypothetical protein
VQSLQSGQAETVSAGCRRKRKAIGMWEAERDFELVEELEPYDLEGDDFDAPSDDEDVEEYESDDDSDEEDEEEDEEEEEEY